MSSNFIEDEELNKINIDEIDFKEIYQKVVRNKKLVFFITIFGVFLGLLNIISAKRIWEGEFQIVLDDTLKENNIRQTINSIPSIPNFNSVNNVLETQVGILKSPLVLSKVFEFVKKEKSIKDNQQSSLKFKNWKNNSLDISLEEGTSILKISYRDDKKEIVLPVLKRISNSYQEYSGRYRSREIELSKNFYKKQIEIFRKKSINSLRNAQKFATAQDLTILSGEATIDKDIPNIINIESIRVNSANEIRNINIQLDRLNGIIDAESIIYLGRSIPEIVSSGLPDRLEQIEEKLISLETLREEISESKIKPEKIKYFVDSIAQIQVIPQRLKQIETEMEFAKSVYKEDDKVIVDLKRERETLIEVLKKQSIGYLEAKIIKTTSSKPKLLEKLKEQSISYLKARKKTAEAMLKAAERPEGVLIEYKQLIRTANKDKATLDNLENDYRAILLEEARINDPWELITTPTLFSRPVSPNKRQIILITFFFSLFISSLIAIFLDQKKNIIFSINELKSLTNWKILSQISIKEDQNFNKSLIYILESNLNANKNSIEVLLIGDFEIKFISRLEEITRNIKSNKFKVLTNIFDLNDSSQVIVVTGLGITAKDICVETAEKLKIKQKNIIGNLVLKDFTINSDKKDEIEIIITNSGKFLKKFKSSLSQIYKKYSLPYFRRKLEYYIKIFKKSFK